MGYEVSRIKFEIPGFGLIQMTPFAFVLLSTATKGMTGESIRKELTESGWELDVLSNPAGCLALVEWQAIWGECHGYGL